MGSRCSFWCNWSKWVFWDLWGVIFGGLLKDERGTGWTLGHNYVVSLCCLGCAVFFVRIAGLLAILAGFLPILARLLANLAGFLAILAGVLANLAGLLTNLAELLANSAELLISLASKLRFKIGSHSTIQD